MSVEHIQTKGFRNLADDKIVFNDKLNLLVGANGSGKSSLLEALFYLSHGKSFRTTNVNNLINSEQQEFIVSTKTINKQQLGVLRNRSGDNLIKVNGKRESKLSVLAREIAVQVVTPESFKLFFGGPRERRKFVDLGLFHVEHSFAYCWRDFNKVHKQRNACLKNGVLGQQLSYWTEEFCQLSIAIAQYRERYIKQLEQEIAVWLGIMLPDINEQISLSYLQGWNSKKELIDVLMQNEHIEKQKGYSAYGAHKFDIRFTFSGVSLEQKLSRGQQKLFLLALTFAQSKLIDKVKRIKPILLIDDIGAELDIYSRTALAKASNALDCQIVISAIDKDVLEPIVLNNDNYKMFHVEHGKISVMSE